MGNWDGARDEKQRRFEESEDWKVSEGVAYRTHGDYDEYIAVQASKLDRIEDALKSKNDETYVRFRTMFKACKELEGRRNVLCLGARLGMEVKALIDLGHMSVGIDINPGSDNYYVLNGDFHQIVFADNSFDAVYTNTVDHCLEPAKLLAEINRVLVPGGLFVMDISRGFDEGYAVDVDWGALAWSKATDFAEYVRELGNFELLEHYELPDSQWTQVLYETR